MKRAIIILAVLVVAGAAGILAYARLHHGRNTLPPQYKTQQRADTPVSTKKLDHVIVILEENKPRQSIIGSAAAPYINSLARTYATAEHYYAVTNPSLPNYIALTSGTTAGISSDCNPPGGSCIANVSSIADRLESAGISWKMYAESMPGSCSVHNSGDYAVKHNPFLYYPDILHNSNRCAAHDVPFSQFSNDITGSSTLPDFSLISPNLCHDMHNCSIQTGDAWLSEQVPHILQSPAFTSQKSLLVIVWDEGNALNNNVPVIFVGPDVKKGYTATTYFSHYSLLHTIEAALAIQPLTTNDASAPMMTEMLR